MEDIRYKFLVVDDSKVDRLIASVLLKTKFDEENISAVESVDDAVVWLLDNRTDTRSKLVILLDVRMPNAGGFGFLNAYDKLEENIKERTSILMLSSTLDPNDLDIASSHKDVKGLLSKPLNMDELMRYIV